ncbi:MAG: DUF4159 domain-containing protein [Planctomycetota bacterium]
MRSALPSPNSVLARSPAWLLTVAAALVSVSWGVPALAGPNLVANGDLNHTDQDAAARVGIGEKAAYFTFDGDGDFGRVVATTTGSMTALKNELRIAYVELGKVATGGPRGLLIDTKNLKSGGDVDISVWFDLQGKIRPKKEYEWTVAALVFGAERAGKGGFKLIAPALWADGEPLGAEVDVAFDGRGVPTSGSTHVRNFERQTGAAAMVLKLPRDLREQFLILRMSLREVDEALVRGEEPPMPVPVRYVPIADPLEFRLAEALKNASEYLRGLQDERSGGWLTGDREQSIRISAMVTSALTELGDRTDEGPLALALEWLSEQLPEDLEEGEVDNRSKRLQRDLKLTDTVAWRLYCLARYGDPRNRNHQQAIAHDITWLEDAQFEDGGWATRHREDDAAKALHSDNDSSALAVSALREAFFAGKPCKRSVWIEAAKYWVAAQAGDGGYRGKMDKYGGVSETTTAMRTSAGVASLLATMDMAFAAGGDDSRQFRKNKGQMRALREGFGWLDANYKGESPIGSYLEYRLTGLTSGGWNPYAKAFYMQRLGSTSGRHLFGDLDHVLENARLLLGGNLYNRETAQFSESPFFTAWALVSLAAVDSPTVLQRIVIGGDEGDEFARDADHIVRYLSAKRRTPLNWRATTIDRPAGELSQIPVLYLNIAGRVDWTAEQWAKIRDYCFDGGVVLINVAAGNEAAREIVESALRTAFPEIALEPLPPADPLLTIRRDVKLDNLPQVLGNGLKHFLVLLPEDWSCTWHTFAFREYRERYDFVDNLLEYTTDGEKLVGTFGRSHREEATEATRTVPVARVECGSDLTAYPDFLKTLDRAMRANYRTALKDVSDGQETPTLFWLANAGEKPLTQQQQARIRAALDDGAYLFAEVVGGNKDWAEAFRADLQKLDPELTVRKLYTSHPIFQQDAAGGDQPGRALRSVPAGAGRQADRRL